MTETRPAQEGETSKSKRQAEKKPPRRSPPRAPKPPSSPPSTPKADLQVPSSKRSTRAQGNAEKRAAPLNEHSDDEFPSVRRERVVRSEHGSCPSSKGSRVESHASTDATRRAIFYEYLKEYREHIGKDLVKSVSVTRRPIDLWDLWFTATSQNADHELRDWEDIAKSLGFDWLSNPTATHQLKKAFEVHLRDYELLRLQYLEEQESVDSENDSGD